MENENNDIITETVLKPKKPQSEALKRAKAKYYQKKKQDPLYVQDMRDRALKWYYIKNLNEIEIYFPKIALEKNI
jgi:hypothetical protein